MTAEPTGVPGERVDFFISYTEADVAWATWVGQVLEAEGVTVTLQRWDSPAGENFVVWISRQLDAAEHTIAVCSPRYFESHWCTRGSRRGRDLYPDAAARRSRAPGPFAWYARCAHYVTGYTIKDEPVRCDVFILPGDRHVILFQRVHSSEV